MKENLKSKKATLEKVIISVAWPYANGDLHLGHPAGYLLPASVLNDFLRLSGRDVIMVSGSDMHGTPIAVKAWKLKQEPQELATAQHLNHLKVMKLLKLKYSLYTSTQTKLHSEITQTIFIKLLENGYIFKEKTNQYWSNIEKKFLLDRFIEGECPLSLCFSKR